MLLIIVTLLTGAGFLLLLNCLDWRLRAHRVEATIIGVREAGVDDDDDRQTYIPVYQYTDDFGRTVQVMASGGSGQLRRMRTGGSVSLMVAPDDPQNVRVANSWFIEFAGAAFFCIGLWQLTLARWPLERIVAILAALGVAYFALRRSSLKRKRSPAVDAGPIRPAEEFQATPGNRREVRRQRLFAPVLVLLGVLFIAAGGYTGREMLRLKTMGLRAPGTVVRIDTRLDDGTVYYAVVRYTPADRSSATEFVDGSGANPALYRVGDRVEVIYLNGAGATAAIDRGVWTWLPPLMFAGIGVVCAIGGLSMLLQPSPPMR